MFKLLSHHEHFKGKIEITLPITGPDIYSCDFFKRKGEQNCFTITRKEQNHDLQLSYFVGVDWVTENETALFVEPKLNKEDNQTDYLGMLFSAMKHPEVAKHTHELFEIKFDAPYIEISQQQDLLTPLLIVQFLRLIKDIVRKGLKKSYNIVQHNLNARVKGKVLLGQTIKQNVVKNKQLHTFCTYEEFGVNGLENRLVKKTLIFIQRYLPSLNIPGSKKFTQELLDYIMPAFAAVDGDVNVQEIKHSKTNVFYKEYTEAITIAKLILKRFGYNISNIEQQKKVKTPPFWIDMSKLFELYVLGILKDRFPSVSTISYQFGNRGSKLDFLLNSEEYKMVVDAKYKTKYNSGVDHWDIRQVSGYARLKKVYETLNIMDKRLIDCLIIYPDQIDGFETLPLDLTEAEIDEYFGMYKVGIKLPTVGSK